MHNDLWQRGDRHHILWSDVKRKHLTERIGSAIIIKNQIAVERKRCFMAKDLSISMLYDFYGDLLTEKQQEVIELYYNEDLSLSEIASHSGITRQGVRDSIKRAEFQLSEFEEQLGLASRFEQIKDMLDDILKNAFEIEQINSRLYNSKDISTRVGKITALARHVAEL